MSHYSISRIPEAERPRERLQQHGAEAMSNADLLAIILGSGSKSVPVLQLAQDIMEHFGSLPKLAEATIEELCHIKGLGKAKATQLKACFSIGNRISKLALPVKYRIEHPIHAYHLIKDLLEHEKREIFYVIMQDAKGYVINHQVVAIGTLSQTLVHPREVFYPAIRHKASSIIIAHNHPSGDPTPSKQDYEVTKVLIEAGKVIGIPVKDHLIIGLQTFESLRQKNFSFD